VQFGNDDVSSKVLIMAQATLVGLSGMSNGFSCALPCHCGVGAAVECPYGNDDGHRNIAMEEPHRWRIHVYWDW
jgi:hypothetical protein